MHRSCRTAIVAFAGVALAACGAADASSPPFSAQPSYDGDGGPSVELPGPNGSTPSNSGGSSAQSPSSGSSSTAADPAVVATRRTTPDGIAVLPDGTALVAERTTGKILHVQKQASRPVAVVRTLTGLDARGDGGLLDIAISPTYVQDDLIYALVTTGTDNRVVHFTAKGPITTVLSGIPKGATGNRGRIVFDRDGALYVGTGDAGKPALAQDRLSLAGKVLRVDDVGRPFQDNPTPGSRIYTSGHREVDGLCIDPASDVVFEVETTTGSGGDEVNRLQPGANYGWGAAGSGEAPITTLPRQHDEASGCAIETRGFFVSTLAGRSLLATILTGGSQATRPGAFTPGLDGVYGRLRNVVPAPDGALWLTTSNKDGKGTPVPADERVLRIVPSSLGGSNPV